MVIDASALLFFFQAEDGIRYSSVTGVQTCAFFFSSRRRHTRFKCDWNSDVCSSDLAVVDLRRSRNKTVSGQPGASAQHRPGELKNIRVADDPRILPVRFRRSHKHPHERRPGGNVHIFRCDQHCRMIHQATTRAPVATMETGPTMDLREKAAQLPLLPGVYLYQDAHGTVKIGRAHV